MKRTLCLVICILLTASLFGGCNTEPAETTAPSKEHVLKVGYGRTLAMPEDAVPVAGNDIGLVLGSSGDDKFYVTCIALTDQNDTTILIYHLDLVYPGATISFARRDVSKETGVPMENIILCTTHNHTAPALDVDHISSEHYSKSYKGWMVEAAVSAMADRKPAKTSITTTHVQNSTFVRHFIKADGSRGGWSKDGVNAQSTVYEADTALQLIKFTREGAKDIILMNWHGHPMSNRGGVDPLKSDVDVYRRILEAELDCHFAYFLGASGDVAYNISLTHLRKEPWYTDDYIKRGTELAGHAVTAAKAGFEEVNTSALQLLHTKVPVKFGNGTSSLDISIAAFSFGDIAFAIVPYEMFNCNGTDLKNGSPFKMTFVSTCSNGYASYIPAAHAYEYDCYEMTRGNYVKGSAEQLVDSYLTLLNQMHGAK